MACGNSCEKNTTTTNCQPKCHTDHHTNNGGGYVCIVVLYILLAIIIGSIIAY